MSFIGEQIVLRIDRILFATDFSPASEEATAYVRAMAKRFSSALTLANVVDLSIATRSEAAVVEKPIDEMRRTSAENLNRLLSDTTSLGFRAKAQTLESHDQQPRSSLSPRSRDPISSSWPPTHDRD